MKSIRVCDNGDGKVAFEPLALPFNHFDKVPDAEEYQRRLAGVAEASPIVTLIETPGLQTFRYVENRNEVIQFSETRHLGLIVSGSLELTVGCGDAEALSPGDVYFIDGVGELPYAIATKGDFRCLHVDVPDSWVPSGSIPGDSESDEPTRTNLKRMYRGHDNHSHFRPFDTLFADRSGQLSVHRPSAGFAFSSFAPDLFIDWHPEVVNQLALVLSGSLEVEVGAGEQRIEVFAQGDVLLAEDRTGVGHIDRILPDLKLFIMVFEDRDLW
jgi:quercetin dioxygenase-like cupin family protein